jgi:hypothetical protein
MEEDELDAARVETAAERRDRTKGLFGAHLWRVPLLELC